MNRYAFSDAPHVYLHSPQGECRRGPVADRTVQ